MQLRFQTRSAALAAVLSASVAWGQHPQSSVSPHPEEHEATQPLPVSRSLESPQSLDSGGSEFADVEPEAPDPCDIWGPEAGSTANCNTPRLGVLSGFYFGLDAGYATIAADAADKDGIGPGFGIYLRLGFEFWDHLVAVAGFGGFVLNDRAPITEMVVDCTSVDGEVISCSDEADEQRSNVTATVLLAEVGVQHRFRPTLSLSCLPGITLGYQGAISDLKRSVDCQGCETFDLDASANGVYLGPFFRLTFGNLGMLGLTVRSQWYLSSDVAQVSTLGVEYGLP